MNIGLEYSTEKFIIISESQDEIDHFLAWNTGLKNVVTIANSFQDHAQLKRWCEENCKELVVYCYSAAYKINDRLYFYDEEEAAACKLMWT